jgi:hypothetical protein
MQFFFGRNGVRISDGAPDIKNEIYFYVPQTKQVFLRDSTLKYAMTPSYQIFIHLQSVKSLSADSTLYNLYSWNTIAKKPKKVLIDS